MLYRYHKWQCYIVLGIASIVLVGQVCTTPVSNPERGYLSEASGVEFVWPQESVLQRNRALSSSTFRGEQSSNAKSLSASFPPVRHNGYQPTSFDFLAQAQTWMESGRVKARVPDSISKLHDKKVALCGYPVPLFQTAEGRTVFLLFRNREASNESLEPHLQNWCCVHLDSHHPVPPSQLLQVFGILQVEPTVIGGQLCCLYSLRSAVLEPVSTHG